MSTSTKIFIIGFNRTGTRTLSEYFSRNGNHSIHHHDGALARRIKNNHERGIKLLTGYEKYTVFSDMECYPDLNYAHVAYFREFDKMYPDSKFILNVRDVDNWIESRNKHGNYTKNICKILSLTKQELNQKWKDDFYDHKKNVMEYFSGKPNKLLVYDIENDAVHKINEFFPELQLDTKHYGHIGQTRT